MKCNVCNHENQNDAQYCSQCGTLLNPMLENGLDAYSDPKSNCNTIAIIGLIVSIVSIYLCIIPILGTIVSLSGIILSLIAKIQLNYDGKKGKDLAIAGIVVSFCSFLASILILVLLFN